MFPKTHFLTDDVFKMSYNSVVYSSRNNLKISCSFFEKCGCKRYIVTICTCLIYSASAAELDDEFCDFKSELVRKETWVGSGGAGIRSMS